MIKIERIKVENFVATISGNGGEEELVIMSSPIRGQCWIGAMAATVLGPVRMIRDPFAVVPGSEQDVLCMTIAQWTAYAQDPRFPIPMPEWAQKQAREAAMVLERAWDSGENVEEIWPRPRG